MLAIQTGLWRRKNSPFVPSPILAMPRPILLPTDRIPFLKGVEAAGRLRASIPMTICFCFA